MNAGMDMIHARIHPLEKHNVTMQKLEEG